MPRKKKIDEFIAMLVVEDEEGWLLRQRFIATSEAGVQVETQFGLMGQPLALAALLIVAAHAICTTERVPAPLRSDLMMAAEQVKSLATVRRAAKNRRRHDPKDHGVSDDWPTVQDDSEIPF